MALVTWIPHPNTVDGFCGGVKDVGSLFSCLKEGESPYLVSLNYLNCTDRYYRRRMCLARGRSYIVPVTHTLRTCEQWHISKIADTMDGHLVSMAVLRRDLVSYISPMVCIPLEY